MAIKYSIGTSLASAAVRLSFRTQENLYEHESGVIRFVNAARLAGTRSRGEDRDRSSGATHPSHLCRRCASGAAPSRNSWRRPDIERGDRVGIALPNGLPMIVSFLAAAVGRHRGAAESRRTGKTNSASTSRTPARASLILPPDGAEEARRAAGDRVPILTVDMDAAGAVSLCRQRPAPRHGVRRCADGRRRRAGPAYQRQHRAAQARAAHAREPVHLGRQRRAQLRASARMTCRCA